MAISNEQSILSMLKVWYKDGVENLMFRNSPVLRKLNKTRVEGKVQNFSAMYGRGGACGGDFMKASTLASTVSKNVEFSVEPGQIFSVYTMNAKEVQASKTQRGAYMKIAGSKMFAASEGFRKVMAAALYGRGYGELCLIPGSTSLSSSPVAVTLPADAIMKIDVGSQLVVKTSIEATSAAATITVTQINGNSVTVTSDTSYTTNATDVLCLAGSMDASGNPLLPVGLAGWLPTVAKRSGATWTTYIGTKFFNVYRNVASDRLAGAFYAASASNEKYSVSIQALIKKLRRQGSVCDMIVLNDDDFAKLASEIETTNTFFTSTATKEKKNAAIGVSEISAAFSTNFVENLYDDCYCPKGRFYVLDTSAVEIWSYTNVDKLDDGIVGNNAGKQDPMSMDAEGKEDSPYALIIDDYLNVKPGADTVDGPSTQVSLQFYGSFVVTNPSVCGVGEFIDSTDFDA